MKDGWVRCSSLSERGSASWHAGAAEWVDVSGACVCVAVEGGAAMRIASMVVVVVVG